MASRSFMRISRRTAPLDPLVVRLSKIDNLG